MTSYNINLKKFGIIILKKDSILYHTSDNKSLDLNYVIKPLLFCSFHPIDYEGYNTKYIHLIKLKKDVKLFFMVDDFFINPSRRNILSAFSHFFQSNKKNLSKTELSKIINFCDILKSKNLDGWFSSIEDGTGIEVALLNNSKIFNIVRTNNFNSNWNIMNEYGNNKLLLGERYKVCSTYNPVIIIINKKFKKRFKTFYKRYTSSKYSANTVFEKVLENAIIIYMDDNNINNNTNNIIKKYIK